MNPSCLICPTIACSFSDVDERTACGMVARELIPLLNTQQLNLRGNNPASQMQCLIEYLSQFILPGAHVGTWVWNVQNGALILNNTCAQMLGYEDTEHLQQLTGPIDITTWERLTHPDDLRNSRDLLELHFKDKSHFYECIARMRHTNGSEVFLLDRGCVITYDSNGMPLWMVGIHVPITGLMHELGNAKVTDHQLHQLHEHLQGFVYQYKVLPDGTSCFPYVSGKIEDIYGCTPDDVKHSTQKVFDVIHPDDLQQVQASIDQSARSLTPWKASLRVMHPTKGLIWVSGAATPQAQPDGSVIWHGYLWDNTEQEIANTQLRLAQKVFEASHEGILITDPQGRIVSVNQAFERITGYTLDQVRGKNPSILSSGRQNAHFYQQLWTTLTSTGHWHGEIWNRKKDGQVYAELLSINAIYDQQHNVTHYCAIFTDINDLKQQQAKLEHLAHFDPLTGLANRRLLTQRIATSQRYVQDYGGFCALIFLDLDGFKQINDTYGHGAGDALLCCIADAFLNTVRPHDTCSRIGGDEFLVLLHQVESVIQVQTIVQRLIDVCALPYVIEGISMQVSASAGVVLYPTERSTLLPHSSDASTTGPSDDPIDADWLIRAADQAMYQAKQHGKRQYLFFDVHQDQQAKAHYMALSNLNLALQQGQFQMFLQPKIHAHSGALLGAEALVRWIHPTQGIVVPSQFMDTVFASPLEIPFGTMILELSFALTDTILAKHPQFQTSINISAAHLISSDFIHTVSLLMQKYPNCRGHIIIEILESTQLTELPKVNQIIEQARQLGCSFSLDDFGTGYSSLGYLRALDVQEVKIDQTFVRQMLANPNDKLIVQGICDLCHALGRKVVAEGVETTAHIALLQQIKVDVLQGYAFTPPIALEQFLPWTEHFTPIFTLPSQSPCDFDS